jgi:high affinity Mn2+ porin
MIEYNQSEFALRFASVTVPEEANQMKMDTRLDRARGDNLEFEGRYSVASHPGKIRILSYMNHAHMGNYRESVDHPTAQGFDITSTRDDRTKYGYGLNVEQELSPRLGAFARWGWNDGRNESWAFTEVDSTISLGISWKTLVSRDDRLGVAGIYNEISQDHRDYLAAGGKGFIVGEGGLTYAPEKIFEVYYAAKIGSFVAVTLDLQYANDPGYNRDHSDLTMGAVRLHCEL